MGTLPCHTFAEWEGLECHPYKENRMKKANSEGCRGEGLVDLLQKPDQVPARDAQLQRGAAPVATVS
jgi:hypothetical protein